MSTLPYALGVVSIHTEVATMLNNYQSSQHCTSFVTSFNTFTVGISPSSCDEPAWSWVSADLRLQLQPRV